MNVSTSMPVPTAQRSSGRNAGICLPRALSPLRGAWPLPVARVPDASWASPLRDWVCWASAADFITIATTLPVAAHESVLPEWARPLTAARRLRELAVEGAVGSWTTQRIRRLHQQLAPTVPGGLRERSAWFGGGGGETPLQLAPTPEMLPGLLDDLCEFIDWRAPDTLAQAALVHAQVLAIQPFADGNARLARVMAAAVAARGGIAPEAMFPVFAIARRNRHEVPEAASHSDAGAQGTVVAWRDAFRRGLAFAGVMQGALDQWLARAATRLGSEARAQRLLEIASARPVLDAYLVRATAGIGAEALAQNWQTLREEGWTPIGGDSDSPAWLAGTRMWQRAAALWSMAANSRAFEATAPAAHPAATAGVP